MCLQNKQTEKYLLFVVYIYIYIAYGPTDAEKDSGGVSYILVQEYFEPALWSSMH